MKSLLIGIIALGSTTSYAMTEFEQALSESEIIFQGSKNSKPKLVNDDGSTTIVEPKFSNPKGSGSLRLSVENDSNLDGICKLFGAGSYVSNSATYVVASDTLVRISSNGTFERFDFLGSHKNALQSLICLSSTQAQVGPSDNAKDILTNDDGSITIVEPEFSNPTGSGGLRLSVENDSNLDGICKLFGAGSYVSNSATYVGASDTLVRISSNGTFQRFDYLGSRKNALHSLICRPR